MTNNWPATGFLVQVIYGLTRLSGMDIGDKIRRARKAVGWTQVQLAAAVGVDKSAVAQWENAGAARKGITTENLKKVAAVLGIRLSELLEDEGADTDERLSDPREISLVQLFRRMPSKQKDVMLELFYTTTQLGEGDQAKRDPQKRRRIGG